MKKIISMFAIIIAALLLSACAPNQSATGAQLGSMPTVEDLFTDPVPTVSPTYPTTKPGGTTTTEPNETTQPNNNSTVLLGNIGMALVGEKQQDEIGTYYVYNGGEAVIPIKFMVSGNIAEKGIGVLLFVDGQPQPYKTDEDSEYAYLHIFYPSNLEQEIHNLAFVPVTGKQGDELEIYTASVLHPTYSKSEGYMGMVYTSGSVILGSRLKYEQTPPAEGYPEKQQWLSDTSVSFVDVTADEIRGWSDDDLRERIAYKFSVNETDDMSKREVYVDSTDEYISVRYEIWGSPYVNYGLVFFVDNVPVSGTDVENLMIEVKNGQKTVVEAKLDLKQFDGESVVYAILVPRNYRSSEVETAAYLTCTNAIFLLEAKA